MKLGKILVQAMRADYRVKSSVKSQDTNGFYDTLTMILPNVSI